MAAITCTLVGFRYHAWRGDNLASRLSQAQGQRVILMRDSENHRNHEAAVAYIDTQVVAYVTNDDCHRLAAYIDDSQYGLLYGYITEVSACHCRCTARIEVDREMDVPPLVGDGSYTDWDSRWQEIPIIEGGDHELRLRMLQRHLICVLNRHLPADETLCGEIEAYMQATRYDISAEATDNRRLITDLLAASPDSQLRCYADKMELVITDMGSNAVCQDVATHMGCHWAANGRLDRMIRRCHDIDRLRIEEALAQFPHGLHTDYRLSVSDFVSRAYYLHIPRQPLRRFISAELLLDGIDRLAAGQGLDSQTRHEIEAYVQRIDQHATPKWQQRIGQLWSDIIDTYAERLTKVNGARDTRFNARFVCMVIGRLIEAGVYDQTVTQTEYGRLLTHCGRDMRSSINRGLSDDKAVRNRIDSMMHSKATI